MTTPSAADAPARPPAPLTVYGFARVSWVGTPLARMQVSEDGLELRVPLLGHYRFAPHEVVSLEPSRGGWIQIEHIRPDTPRSVMIAPLGPRKRFLNRVAEAGFVATGKREDEPETTPALHRRFIALLVFGQLATMIAVAWRSRLPTQPEVDPLMIAWLLSVFSLSVLIRIKGPIRRFAVTSEVALARLRAILNVTTLITGLLLLELLFEQIRG